MKLTEAIVCVAIFLISVTIFLSSLINIRQNINSSTKASVSAISLIHIDYTLRKEIQEIKIPYWKNFNKSFISSAENLRIEGQSQDIKITSVSPAYDVKHKAEGINIEWEMDGKKYITTEYIKQRIIDEK